jgi:hypothetical protein
MNRKEVKKKPKGITTQYRNYVFTVDVYGEHDTAQYQLYAIAESPAVARNEIDRFLQKNNLMNYNINTSSHGTPVKLLSKQFLIDIHGYADRIIKAEKKAAEKQYKKDILSASKSAKLTVGSDIVKKLKHII